ncbi:MAG: HAMP domain-containing histidine kinase [Gemmatimonadales bacterium]|nr:HAMP domain-containing histidine kinase [Gemmatimonadales bacterium]
MAADRLRRLAPALLLLLVAMLVGLSLGTSLMVMRHFRREAQNASQLFVGVFAALNDSREGAEAGALLRLGEEVRQLGMPLVVTDWNGRITAFDNLPFAVEGPDDPALREYVRRLDRWNPPVSDSLVGQVHYGALPAGRFITTLVILEAATIAVFLGLAVYAWRAAMAAQRDRVWVAMAREAAHQLGTPLMSLHGWIEALRSRPVPPAGLADYLMADTERLDRVAQRFERIGNLPRREPVGLGALADRVAHYFRPRLPKHANHIDLRVEAASAGPTVRGDAVLLEWALEALVKNAIDALQGRGGTIIIATRAEGDAAELRVTDDGPGIPREMRRRIFEPGISTKEGGWGIGLALARRVVEDGHGGKLDLDPLAEHTTFVLRVPMAEAA